jgi:hypothetical protein
MEQETLNLSIRRFLKMVGISSQREIEQAVAKSIASSELAGVEAFPATMTLRIPALHLEIKFDGQINLK